MKWSATDWFAASGSPINYQKIFSPFSSPGSQLQYQNGLAGIAIGNMHTSFRRTTSRHQDGVVFGHSLFCQVVECTYGRPKALLDFRTGDKRALARGQGSSGYSALWGCCTASLMKWFISFPPGVGEHQRLLSRNQVRCRPAVPAHTY